jgi:hypothetical protein
MGEVRIHRTVVADGWSARWECSDVGGFMTVVLGVGCSQGRWSATNRVANGGLDAQMSKMLWGNRNEEVEKERGKGASRCPFADCCSAELTVYTGLRGMSDV